MRSGAKSPRARRIKSKRTGGGKSHIRVSGDEMRIRVSPLMLLMAVYFVAAGMAYEFVCTLAAVLLHECAHAKVAKHFGYELNVIKLMPYGAALCGDVGMKPKHEAFVAAAGPALNIALALVFAALWWLLPASYMFTRAFCLCNMYIGVFNLLPVYPLDGGRVLFALLSSRIKRGRAFKIMRIISAVTGVATLALFVLSVFYSPNICLLSVGIFMLFSAFIPDRRAQYTALFELSARRDKLKKPTELAVYAVSEHAPLSELVTCLNPERYTEFAVMSDGFERVGTADETDVVETVKSGGYTLTAGDAVKRRPSRSL